MTPPLQQLAPHPSVSDSPGAAAELAPTAALIYLLEQFEAVLNSLNDEEYAAPLTGPIAGSIGAHVRHCLDHVAALLTCFGDGVVNYDARERGTRIELDRQSALERLGVLKRELQSSGRVSLDCSVQVRTLFSASHGPLQVRSSLGRELAFVLSHTIHHQAMIASVVRALGGVVPDYFGYAPATIKHLSETSGP